MRLIKRPGPSCCALWSLIRRPPGPADHRSLPKQMSAVMGWLAADTGPPESGGEGCPALRAPLPASLQIHEGSLRGQDDDYVAELGADGLVQLTVYEAGARGTSGGAHSGHVGDLVRGQAQGDEPVADGVCPAD